MLKKVLLLLLFSTGVGSVSAMTIDELLSDPTNVGIEPTPAEINEYILEKCTQYRFPPNILKAMLLIESETGSKWTQYHKYSNYSHKTIIHNKDAGGSYGLGLFQITYKTLPDGTFCSGNPCQASSNLDTEIRDISKNWKSNIDKAFSILNIKWHENLGDSTGDDIDPTIIENWFYPIAWYNGHGKNAKTHVDKVYRAMTSLSFVSEQLASTPNREEIVPFYKNSETEHLCQAPYGPLPYGTERLVSGWSSLPEISAPYVIPNWEASLNGIILPSDPLAYSLAQILDFRPFLHKWSPEMNYFGYLLPDGKILSVAFGDIPPGWMYEHTSAMKCRKIMEGRVSGNFEPTENLDFSEFIKIIVTTFHGQKRDCEFNLLNNTISASEWYCPWYNSELIQSTLSKFLQVSPARGVPGQLVTRSEVAFFLAELIQNQAPSIRSRRFIDIDESPFKLQIEKLGALGVMTGYQNGTAQPNKPISRAEMAKLLNEAGNLLYSE